MLASSERLLEGEVIGHEQAIDVARHRVAPFRHRSVEQREADAIVRRPERICEHLRNSERLVDEAAQLVEDRRARVGPHVLSSSRGLDRHQPALREPVELALYLPAWRMVSTMAPMVKRWLYAIGLAACGSAQAPPKPPEPRPVGEAEPRMLAADCATPETFVSVGASALEGEVVDCVTGEKIPGAMLSVNGTPHLESISDEAGRYHLELPAGRYKIEVVDIERGDRLYWLGEVEVRTEHTTVKQLRVDRRRCPPPPGSVASQADWNAFVAAILERYASVGIPDGPPRTGPGPILVAIEGTKPDTVPTLPRTGARPFVFMSDDDLQREAARRGKEVKFINIREIEVTGTCAAARVGGDFVYPRKGVISLCCCSLVQVYEKRDSGWVYKSSGESICH